MYIIINFSAQGKREKKSSKKSKKAAAAAVEDDQPSETGTGGGASGGGGGGGAAELFDLDMGSQQKQEPVSRFQVLAEDENLKMVGTQGLSISHCRYITTHSILVPQCVLSLIFVGAKNVSCGEMYMCTTATCWFPTVPLATVQVDTSIHVDCLCI